MTLFVPDVLAKIYRNTPDSKKKYLAQPYAYYLKTIIRLRTWFKLDRKNIAPFQPFKTVHFSPKRIKKVVRKKKLQENGLKNPLPDIIGGEWDKDFQEIKTSDKFKSMIQRFEKGKNWEKTPLYRKKERELKKNGSTMYGGHINSIKELEERFQNIEWLYKQIKEKGYLSQAEINEKHRIVNIKVRPNHFLGPLNEVKVCLDRNGNPLSFENKHRLFCAKLQNIEKIPVTVLVRHRKWQEKRNLAVTEPEKLSEETREHPDIKNLLQMN